MPLFNSYKSNTVRYLSKKEMNFCLEYDPSENGLSIDKWSNSNGKEIKYTLEKLISKKLSRTSEKILDVALLTNSYLPSNNISSEEFLDFNFRYLIKKKDPLILPPDYDKLPLPDSKKSDDTNSNRINRCG